MMIKNQKFNMKIVNMKEWINQVNYIKIIIYKGLRAHEEATKFKTISYI